MKQKNLDLENAPAWRKIMRFYRTLKPGLWLMRLPLLGSWLQHQVIIEGRDSNWFVPVLPERRRISIGETIPAGKQQALPGAVIQRLLEEADGIFAMAACPCRTAFHCQEHPWEIGCLHIGPAAKGIPSDVGRLLTLKEALAHLQRALDSGLIPTILYIPSEAEIFGVDKTRMLSLCFCCECCCDVRLLLREGPDRYWYLYNHRLPGLRITVDERCTLCGSCVESCYGGERVITLETSKASINERCIGCGLCVQACPSQAIHLEFDPQEDWMTALLESIRAKADFGPPASR